LAAAAEFAAGVAARSGALFEASSRRAARKTTRPMSARAATAASAAHNRRVRLCVRPAPLVKFFVAGDALRSRPQARQLASSEPASAPHASQKVCVIGCVA
jgi:hypothetical protein